MLSTLHLRVLFLVLTLAMLAVSIARGETVKALSKPEDLELIRSLVQRNLDNYSKIKSYRAEFETTGGGRIDIPLPNGTVGKDEKTSGSGYYLKRGDWYRFDYRSLGQVPASNYEQKNHRMAVLNDSQYAVVWDFDTSISVRSYDHHSLADRSSREIKAETNASIPHPLLHGFVSKHPYNIRERLGMWPEITEWTVTEIKSAAEHLFRVTAVLQNREQQTTTFDANKGYVITSVQIDDTKGTKLLDLTILPVQMSEVWVPQQINKIDNLNGRFFKLHTTAAEVNRDIADSEFEMDLLDFNREKSRMAQYRPGLVNPTMYVFREGNWIPEKYVKLYHERATQQLEESEYEEAR